MSSTQREESLAVLRELLPVGSTARTILRHTSRSGMSRRISVVVVKDGNVRDISWHVANVTGFKTSRDHEGLVVGGAGMDMSFHVVYSLSRALYPDGHRCTGSTGRTKAGNPATVRRCPSNDHFNDYNALSRRFDADYRAAHNGNDESGPEYVAQRQAWIAAQPTYTKTRMHSDGGYAVGQAWL